MSYDSIEIKPYNPHFDAPGETRIGWMEQYFKNDGAPVNDIVDSEKRWIHEE